MSEVSMRTYCVGVLGSGSMFVNHRLHNLDDTREFRAQTKLTDFHVEKLKESLENEHV